MAEDKAQSYFEVRIVDQDLPTAIGIGAPETFFEHEIVLISKLVHGSQEIFYVSKLLIDEEDNLQANHKWIGIFENNCADYEFYRGQFYDPQMTCD